MKVNISRELTTKKYRYAFFYKTYAPLSTARNITDLFVKEYKKYLTNGIHESDILYNVGDCFLVRNSSDSGWHRMKVTGRNFNFRDDIIYLDVEPED